MRKRDKRKKRVGGAWKALLFLLLLLAALLFQRVRIGQHRPATPPAPSATFAPTPEPTPEAAPNEPAPLPLVTAEPTAKPAAEGRQGSGYNAETYQIVSDMIYIRRSDAADGDAQIRTLLERLRKADPALGETWSGIMEYWRYANEEMPINAELPDDLPQDNSLCLAVLGFQLLYDGDMAPELLGRCQVALAAAQQYPNAYIAVTGGGTAGKDKSITEAGAMADWLIAQGIAPERIIREDASLTTDQNAINTCAILIRDYPQVKQLAVISSDYHLPLGCTMFTEAALLVGFYLGEVPYTVVSNAAWATNGGLPGYTGMKNQASYVWIMADPKY